MAGSQNTELTTSASISVVSSINIESNRAWLCLLQSCSSVKLCLVLTVCCTCSCGQVPCRTLMVLLTFSRTIRGVQEDTVWAQTSSATLPDESCQCRENWHGTTIPHMIELMHPCCRLFRPGDAQPLCHCRRVLSHIMSCFSFYYY